VPGDTRTSLGDRTTGPRVGAYALIGRDDQLLLIEHPHHYTLPGGAVHSAEPVEQALRRTLRDQFGATIARLDFCAVVEHTTVQSGQLPCSELAFLFDVTLTNRDHLATAPPHRWASDHELFLLRPEAIRQELIAAAFPAEQPWRAWTP